MSLCEEIGNGRSTSILSNGRWKTYDDMIKVPVMDGTLSSGSCRSVGTHTCISPRKQRKKNRALRRLVYLTWWIAAFSSKKSRKSRQAGLALDCYNTPGMLSCTGIHHGQKRKKKKRKLTMAHNSFRRSVVTIREVYLLYPISVYATTC